MSGFEENLSVTVISDEARVDILVRPSDQVAPTVQAALDMNCVQVVFGGEEIAPDATFEAHGIEDGARLEVRAIQAWHWATSEGTAIRNERPSSSWEAAEESWRTESDLLTLLDLVHHTTGEDSGAEEEPQAGIVVLGPAGTGNPTHCSALLTTTPTLQSPSRTHPQQ